MGRLIIQQPEEHARNRGNNHQIGNAVKAAEGEDFAIAELGIVFLEAADRRSVGEHQRDTINNGLRTQRCEEGRNLHDRNDKAIKQADAAADQQHDEQRGEQVKLGQAGEQPPRVIDALEQYARKARAQAGSASRRKVGALGNQTSRNAQRNQEAHRRIGGKVIEVAHREEVIPGNADKNRYREQQEYDNIIANIFEYRIGSLFVFSHDFVLLFIQTGWQAP